jgi:ribosomal subunit interface protein
MQIPLQITMQNMPRSEALETRIREDAAKLEQLVPRITSCRVAVEEVEKRTRQGREFNVRVEVRAPGHEQAISTLHRHEDVYVAVRDAFDSARRQIQETVAARRP